MRIRHVVFIATVVLCLLPVHFSQPAGATHNANTVYLFIEIETKVYRKDVPISSEHPEVKPRC